MHTRGRFLGDALDVAGHARPALRIPGDLLAEQVENDAPLFRLIGRIELGNRSLAFELDARDGDTLSFFDREDQVELAGLRGITRYRVQAVRDAPGLKPRGSPR